VLRLSFSIAALSSSFSAASFSFWKVAAAIALSSCRPLATSFVREGQEGMIRGGYGGGGGRAAQSVTREAKMAERTMIEMIRYWGVVHFMVVWLEI
jgi:hypothetical protein